MSKDKTKDTLTSLLKIVRKQEIELQLIWQTLTTLSQMRSAQNADDMVQQLNRIEKEHDLKVSDLAKSGDETTKILDALLLELDT